MTEFHRPQLWYAERRLLKDRLDMALARIVELETVLEEKSAALLEADRDCRRYLDELDYVHAEHDDAEKRLDVAEKKLDDQSVLRDRRQPTWLREVEPDRWSISDRD